MSERAAIFKNALTGVMIVLLLIAGMFLMKGYLDGHFNSVQTLQAYISTFGLFAPLILILIQTLQVVLPVLPGFLGCIVGVGMFGITGGFWYNYIGISLGSVIAFLLARRYGSGLVQHMAPANKYAPFMDWVNKQKSYTFILFMAILLPLAPDDFLCYFSGLTKMSAKKFIWIIISAKPWCILFYCVLLGNLT